MRRLVPLCLGLTLAIPAATRAGEPGPANGPTILPGGHVCAHCAAHLPRRIPADANGRPLTGPVTMTSMATGGCAACQGGAETVVMPYSADRPGMAFVGGEAPGYSAVSLIGSNEPAPVGVMRTNYQTTTGSAYSGLPMGASPMMARPPYAPSALPPGAAAGWGQPPLSRPMSVPDHHRPHILAHLLGLRRPRFGEARRERERETHAAIRYDDSATMPSALPASMVYGNR